MKRAADVAQQCHGHREPGQCCRRSGQRNRCFIARTDAYRVVLTEARRDLERHHWADAKVDTADREFPSCLAVTDVHQHRAREAPTGCERVAELVKERDRWCENG
jgi:hypothetical protein